MHSNSHIDHDQRHGAAGADVERDVDTVRWQADEVQRARLDW
jgi:hypothetical protein